MSDQSETSEQAVEEAAERKKRYKKSLNLPRTDFPMKANLAQNEPQTQKRWSSLGLYERIQTARAGAERFVFHDGPPYANGSIHVGHLLNRVLKDFVVRSRTMMGRDCPFVPGWDCHGLPIEHRVMTELQEKGKLETLNDLPDDTRRMAIRRECRKYAAKYQKIQAEQMKRLLTLADFDNPYLTMRPEYEAAALEVFAGLVEQGLVYRDLKPVHWSIANQTALAEAELEYRNRVDPSVYVAFDAVDPTVVGHAFDVEVDEPVGFLIWTTTPWTLPANLLIAVHKDLKYSLVRMKGRLLVVAEGLVEAVCRVAGAEAKTLGETVGFNLLEMRYRHPFLERPFPERAGRIVAADYVTLEDGTGLVHTAPGHGHDDYITGLAEDLEVYNPVLDDGTFDDSVPEWLHGMSVWDANETVPDRLRDSGHLIAAADYEHSYPHDWRSKTPVIFRGTEQWFVAVDRAMKRDGKSLRAAALEASHGEIRFIPEWGEKRLAGMLESRPDWCISRQRSWGLPIPSFRRADGEVFLTAASVRAVARRSAARAATPGSSTRPPSCWPATTRAATPTLRTTSTSARCRRCTTSSTCGSSPARRGASRWSSAAAASPSTSIWRARISTVAGSSPRCSAASAPRACRPTRRS